MRRIGIDINLAPNGRAFPTGRADPVESLRWAADRQLEGVLFRTVYDVSPALDPGMLADLRAAADDLDLYLELGVGKVNPYMTGELPQVRELGDGSYLAGMERMIAACAQIGVHELWTATGGYKADLPPAFATDRFRTDAPWADQLRATEKFLRALRPCLAEHGSHLNLETHEEITGHELLRLVEVVGDDVLGVCLDPANVPVGGESPLDAVERIASHVRMTHLRDAALCRDGAAISRFLAPCGDGVIDWAALVGTLEQAGSAANLTIEAAWPHTVEMPIRPYDAAWCAAYPDLSDHELDQVALLADTYEKRAAQGDAPDLQMLRGVDRPDAAEFIARSVAHLRDAVARNEPTTERDLARSQQP